MSIPEHENAVRTGERIRFSSDPTPTPNHNRGSEVRKETLHIRRGKVVLDNVRTEQDITFIVQEDCLIFKVKSDMDGFTSGAPFYVHDHREGIKALAKRWDDEEDPELKNELKHEILTLFQEAEAIIHIKRRVDDRKGKDYIVLKDISRDPIPGNTCLFIACLSNNGDYSFTIDRPGIWNFKSVSSNKDGNETLTIIISLCDDDVPLIVTEQTIVDDHIEVDTIIFDTSYLSNDEENQYEKEEQVAS